MAARTFDDMRTVVNGVKVRVLLLAVCCAPLLPAQEADSAVARCARTVKAMNLAASDAGKDSLSNVVKQQVRALLDADGGMTIDLTALPLSRVDAPDGRFRLITWNTPHADGTHRFEGMLLVKDPKRQVLYELRDMTGKIASPQSKKLSAENWYGAVYYAVIPPQGRKKDQYTLLGWKGHSAVETRKVIEVLTFNGPAPTFGAPLFDDGRRTRDLRKIFGYGFQASMSLKWDAVNKGIVFDHLSAEDPSFNGQAALMGPDLSFDAYVWFKGHWAYLRDVDARNLDLTKPSKRPAPAPDLTPPER